jgi:hypothetical protein
MDGCEALAPYCRTSDTVFRLCPVTCCGTRVTRATSTTVATTLPGGGTFGGTTVTGTAVYTKGEDAKGVVDVDVSYWSETGSRVDLVPYLVDADGDTVANVLWGSKTMARNTLTNLRTPNFESEASSMAVRLFLLSRTPDGEYTVKFAMKPAGSTWRDRLPAPHTFAPFTFEVRNEWVRVSQQDFYLPANVAGNSIRVPITYWAAGPVKLAVAVDACRSSVDASCNTLATGEGAAPAIFSNGDEAMFDTDPLPYGSTRSKTLVVRVNKGDMVATSWRLFALRIKMGRFDADGAWEHTIDRSPVFGHDLHLVAGAANGELVAASTGSVMEQQAGGQAESSRSATATLWLAVLGCVALLTIGAAGVAIRRSRRATENATVAMQSRGPSQLAAVNVAFIEA